MSKMRKYLNQHATLQKAILDEQGEAKLDDYGKPLYEEAVVIKCRKEPYKVNAFTNYGQFVNYQHTFYVDETVSVGVKDLLDGENVLSVNEYRDGAGSLVGFEVQT